MSIYSSPVPRSTRNLRRIPSPNAVDACWMYDGRTPAGILIKRDQSFFVFSPEGRLIGEFDTRRAAMLAIPININHETSEVIIP